MTNFVLNKQYFRINLSSIKNFIFSSSASVSFIDFTIAILFAGGIVDIVFCPIIKDIIPVININIYRLYLSTFRYRSIN